MNRKGITYFVLIIAVLLIGYVFLTFDSKQVGTEVGNIVPDFTSSSWNTDRDTGSLSDYEGDVIVLNLWATWCEPCRDEMPALMKFHDDYQNEGITVIGANMTRFERAPREETVQKFIEELNITIPIFYSHDDEFYNMYKPLGLPSTYIIDRDGMIQEKITGEVTYEMLEEIVLPLAKK